MSSERMKSRKSELAFPKRQRLLPVVALGLPAGINSQPAPP